MVGVLAFGSKVGVFKRSQGRGIFKDDKNPQNKAMGPVSQDVTAR
jgi:hypothetical protein